MEPNKLNPSSSPDLAVPGPSAAMVDPVADISDSLEKTRQSISDISSSNNTTQTIFIISIVWIACLTIGIIALALVTWRRRRRNQNVDDKSIPDSADEDMVTIEEDIQSYVYDHRSQPMIFRMEEEGEQSQEGGASSLPSFSKARAAITSANAWKPASISSANSYNFKSPTPSEGCPANRTGHSDSVGGVSARRGDLSSHVSKIFTNENTELDS